MSSHNRDYSCQPGQDDHGDWRQPSAWARFLDALLGHHCRYGCGERVYPRDITSHEQLDHAGDDHLLDRP